MVKRLESNLTQKPHPKPAKKPKAENTIKIEQDPREALTQIEQPDAAQEPEEAEEEAPETPQETEKPEKDPPKVILF